MFVKKMLTLENADAIEVFGRIQVIVFGINTRASLPIVALTVEHNWERTTKCVWIGFKEVF